MENTSQSEQTVSDLRNAYAAFNRGDIDDALRPLDPQIEWSEPAEFPGGGTYHGLAGVKRYLTQSRAGFEEGGSEPEQFIPAGNKIVVFVHARVRPKQLGLVKELRRVNSVPLVVNRLRSLQRRHELRGGNF